MRDDAGQTPRAAADDGEVEAFFRLAGRRPRLPEREVAPAREVVRAAWQGQVRRTARVRLVGLAAALAAGALLVTGSLWLGLERPAARSLGALALESGEVTLSGPGGRPQALAPGTVIATGSGARAAVRLASGPSVRIDEGSLVRLESAEVVALDRGALYVDSGAAPGSAALEVATPLGTVRHLGTQFETRLLTGEDGSPPGRGPAALRVRVREGAVVVRRGEATNEVRAGGELTWYRGGELRRAQAPPHGPLWRWAERSAPPLAIEDASLARFLAWVSRETGLVWRYSEPGMAGAAEGITLHGSIEGLTPEEALAVVLPGCGFRHRRVDGELVLLRDPSP
ncbi:MAG TPA: FecR family protein [Thermoanaerobaculia bacterium]|nr:FecR family protein [Thermoanaerobaculia bacterium]